ncbi:LysM peptidoglycan-binding domain-containing protein [Streptosporangium sp. NBC_01755]|uniref:LysM peptidoglycan-binding domain-containing protein n=1 Tax=Streptosporangium sp. NBC_01755 TaxID=2975949 RepID=UPI002DDA828C|nr:LysM peptidoglycan-binding domain-containing protein [Streptosporangium sp. NBC_01755]WSD01294.1 LysM peptidoglycan-binding domain-containing protein [Streptosporangium sp. NBC_01755]
MAVVVLALFTLGVLWIGGRIDTALAGERTGPEGLPRITVHAGDTLWEIADALTQEGDAGRTVRRIVDLNGLAGSAVRPGTRLYLPEGLIR